MRTLIATIILLTSTLPMWSEQQEPVHKEETQNDKNSQPTKQIHSPASSGQASGDSAAKPATEEEHNKNKGMNFAFVPKKIPIEPIKDVFDYIAFIWTGVLAVVGVVGAGVAIRTLKAINRQAHYMREHARHLKALVRAAKDSAEASRVNADTLMEMQRPKITAKGHKTLENFQSISLSDNPRIEIELDNSGATAAHDCWYETWIELLPKPFVDFTPSAEHFKSEETITLVPNSKGACVINIPIRKEMSETDLDDLTMTRRLLCFRILVHYRDFKPDRYSSFAFYLRPPGLGFLPRYNDCD